jgi:hypothetical protein
MAEEHVCDGGPEVREPSGDPRYVMAHRYCTTCGELSSSETQRA